MKPQKFLIALTAGILCAVGQSNAQIVLSDAFNNESVPNTSVDSTPASSAGYWQPGGTANVSSVVETAGGLLTLSVDGGGAIGSAQTASSRTAALHSYLNFFDSPLEFTLDNVAMSATEVSSGGVTNGVFQIGLSPVVDHSTNTGQPNIFYFRIRTGTGAFDLFRRQESVLTSLVSGTWAGPFSDMSISLYLDATNYNLSIASGASSYTSGLGAHGLSASIWDAPMGFGMWAQSFGGSGGNGPSVFTSIDTLTVTAIPEPSTYALLFGVGFVALIIYRRRRMNAGV